MKWKDPGVTGRREIPKRIAAGEARPPRPFRGRESFDGRACLNVIGGKLLQSAFQSLTICRNIRVWE